MRTNIVIDDELLSKGMKYTGIKTKKELVNYALEELIRRKERKKILALKGKLHWTGNLEEMRKDRFRDAG
jgi:Arc/MetJ family transcription regulator